MRNGKAAYRVEKGVPRPETKRKGVSKYPLHQLKIGDSFYSPNDRVRQVMYSLARRAGIKVSVAYEGDGVRVWRIA